MSQTKRVRNWECLPHIEAEGSFDRHVLSETYDEERRCRGPRRLYKHHTLSSIRKHRLFRPHEGLVPEDALDLALASPYNHRSELFPDAADVLIQSETLGRDTWRRLRNTRDLTPEREEAVKIERSGRNVKLPRLYNFSHKVVIGGVSDRKSLDHVKLMISSVHSPLSKDGYVRQRAGAFYSY